MSNIFSASVVIQLVAFANNTVFSLPEDLAGEPGSVSLSLTGLTSRCFAQRCQIEPLCREFGRNTRVAIATSSYFNIDTQF